MNESVIAVPADCPRATGRFRRHIFVDQSIRTLGMAIYLCLLFIVYFYALVPRGTFFAINTAPPEWSWTNLLIALVPIVYLPYGFTTVCDYILWLIYAVVVAPTIMLVEPVTGSVPYPLVFGLLLALWLATILSHLNPVALPRLKLGNTSFASLLVASWCVLNGFLLMHYGVTLHLVSFENVYTIRTAFSDASTGLVIYLVNWLANVINVVLLIYALRTKGRRYLLVFVVIGQLDVYGLTGYKSVLAPLVLVPLVLWFGKNRWRWVFNRLGWGLAGVLAVAAFAGYAYSPILLAMVDRVFLAPASLTSLYYQYFSVHPLAGPVYAGFRELYGLSGPFQTPADIIGSLPVFPLKIMANANLFADGYANFGWYGFVIIGVMLGLCLWIIKSITAGLELSVTWALFLVATIDMLNAGLPTILATHGLLLMIVLSYLFPRSTHNVGQLRHKLMSYRLLEQGRRLNDRDL